MWEQKYLKWVNDPNLDNALKDQLLKLNDKEKEDCFFKQIEFGTAGMRGLMGPGCNRMNIYTIRKANVGFARYIISNGDEAKQQGVAIGYDNRFMSYEFAMESARILASYDIKVYIFESLRPTPELSFAVRTLGCFGGIVITASHNPKEYNGYKLYDHRGCQLIPNLIEQVISNINQIEDELSLNFQLTAEQEAKIVFIGQEIDDLYIQAVKDIQLYPQAKKTIKVVFSPQHGTARQGVCRIFDETGYDYILVEEQANPDPAFSGTKSPNPEEPVAYEVGIEYAKRYNADIVLSTDPDADRVGVVVLHRGEYQLISGNQTGSLLIEYICHSRKKLGTLPSNGVIFNTVVTSDLGEKIANRYGVQVEKTLTGFKFIGEKIAAYETTQEKEFIFGYEESYGSLTKPFVRDKDALQACLILAEAANYYQAHGKTLVDVLDELYERYGTYYETQDSITLTGSDGLTKLNALLTALRNQVPIQLGNLMVVAYEDYGTLIRVQDDKRVAVEGFTSSDVLKYYLSDGSWVAIRPSGTEPKCKFYYCIKGEDVVECIEKKSKIAKSLHNYY
jgi:phosphoglucomutase